MRAIIALSLYSRIYLQLADSSSILLRRDRTFPNIKVGRGVLIPRLLILALIPPRLPLFLLLVNVALFGFFPHSEMTSSNHFRSLMSESGGL